jgi:hypothetical protein
MGGLRDLCRRVAGSWVNAGSMPSHEDRSRLRFVPAFAQACKPLWILELRDAATCFVADLSGVDGVSNHVTKNVGI